MAWMATAGSAQPSTRPGGIGYAGSAMSGAAMTQPPAGRRGEAGPPGPLRRSMREKMRGAGIGRRRPDLLEVAAALPVGDRPVEGVPLLARRVEEVVVHRRSERLL